MVNSLNSFHSRAITDKLPGNTLQWGQKEREVTSVGHQLYHKLCYVVLRSLPVES